MRGRILLQRLDTRRYLGTAGEWADSCQKARIFEHTYQALLEGLEHPESTQEVWCFRNPTRNLYTAVRPEDDPGVLPCEACSLADSATHACCTGSLSAKATN